MKKGLSIKKFVVVLLCSLLCVSTVSVTNADAAVRKVRRVKTTKKKARHVHKLTNRVRWNASHTRYARWCKGCNQWITCQG